MDFNANAFTFTPSDAVAEVRLRAKAGKSYGPPLMFISDLGLALVLANEVDRLNARPND